MTLRELITKIESQEFQSKFLVLSGFSTVLSAMEVDNDVSELISLLHDNIDNQLTVSEHIKQLVPQYDVAYMHPYDVPITVYLFVLNQVKNIALLESVLHQISAIQQFFWARKYSNLLLQTVDRITDNQVITFNQTVIPPKLAYKTEISFDAMPTPA